MGRKFDLEHGALTRIDLQAGFSAKQRAKFPADGQAQVGASVFARGGTISLRECFKDVFQMHEVADQRSLAYTGLVHKKH